MKNEKEKFEIVYDIVGSKDNQLKVKCRKCGEITVFTKENICDYRCGKCGIEFKNSIIPEPTMDPANRPDWNIY